MDNFIEKFFHRNTAVHYYDGVQDDPEDLDDSDDIEDNEDNESFDD